MSKAYTSSDFHLIQRYQKANRPESYGLAKFIKGDYMGSAEFENGSVQASVNSLRVHGLNGNLMLSQTKAEFSAILGPLTIIHSKDFPLTEIEAFILDDVERKHRGKEYTNSEWLIGKGFEHAKKTIAWLTVDPQWRNSYPQDETHVAKKVAFWFAHRDIAKNVLYVLLTNEYTQLLFEDPKNKHLFKEGVQIPKGSKEAILRPYFNPAVAG